MRNLRCGKSQTLILSVVTVRYCIEKRSMRHTVCWLLTALSLAAGPASANQLTFNLNANVAPICEIRDIRKVSLEEGSLIVDVVCNADAFKLSLAGDVADIPMQNVKVTGANIAVTGGAVTARPYRPGVFRFELEYDSDLTAATTIVASLELL
jgi:hypothetical protein